MWCKLNIYCIWVIPSAVCISALKGQSHEIFDPQFFSSFEPIWTPDKQAKVFSNSVTISLTYSNFSMESTDSAQYHTEQSKKNLILEH